MTTETKNARIEVFAVGKFTPMNGKPLEFSAETLKAVADSYDPTLWKAPIVVGHPKTDDPAYGWIAGLEFSDETGKLYADLEEIAPSFAQAVKDGHYRNVSMSFFSPGATSNPAGDVFYPKHVGFLGAVPPAVPGLQPVSFAAHDAADVVEFEAPINFASFDAENVGTLFQNIREFFIEWKGKEKADEIIPLWRIDWVRDLDLTTEPDPDFAASNPTKPQKEKAMSGKGTVDFAARQAELDQREADLKAREDNVASQAKMQLEADNVAFAETLISDEKLIPALKDDVVAFLNSVGSTDQTVSFADQESPLDLVSGFKSILDRQPKIVNFGSLDLGDDPDATSAVNFAVADGASVDPASAALDRKARAYMADHPDTDYMAAVSAVQN